MKLAVSLFKFFASLRLAIFLLVSLALLFAAGTLIESAFGTEAARLLIYRSLWMNLFLILLALNVAAAALDRLPWKRKHVGFVITHAGILLILAGALWSRAEGVEGQMALPEGGEGNRIILDQGVLQIFSEEAGPLGFFSIPPRAFAWQGRERLQGEGPKVRLLRHYPQSSRKEKIQESLGGPAALEVVLESSWMKVNRWLLLDDPERSQVLLGPAELRFARTPIGPPGSKGNGFLEFQFPNSTVKIPIPEKMPQKVKLQGTPYQATLLRVLKDAAVDQGELRDRSENWNNPACELVLEGKGIKEKQTVFSNFPDFSTLHGMKPSETGARIYYRRGNEEKPGGIKNELRFIWREGALPSYQIRKGEEISEGELSLGEKVGTGWMDFKFRVEHYYPHAEVKIEFKEEPVRPGAGERLSAIEVELEEGGERRLLWLGQGDRETVTIGSEKLQMTYGLRTLPLGFRVGLKDFRVENYPGTGRPASFESDVTLKDDSRETVRDVTIRMNQPLQYRGFKIFQSGYEQPQGRAEISVFTVAKDPGIPLKYAGAIVLIGGILTMFYTRRFSNRELAESLSPLGILLLGFVLLSGFSLKKEEPAEAVLAKILVQSGGRVKPFESFAGEALLSVAGKSSLEGKGATWTVWQWMARPENWYTKSFLAVRFAPLREELSLMVIGGKISPELVLTHSGFQAKLEEALQKEEKKEPLSALEKKRLELYGEARLFQAIAQGSLPGIFPSPRNPREGWIPPAGLADPAQRALLESEYSPSGIAGVQAALARLMQEVREGKGPALLEAARQFSSSLEELLESRGVVLDQNKIKAELLYNASHPFQWAWILYLGSALLWFFLRNRFSSIPLALFIGGFAGHTLGFILRSKIAGRPPVTNMYESVIWVAWAAVFFSVVLGIRYRKSVLAWASAGVASLILFIGESFPAVLDPSLSPLVPVLRNNYWLTIHVLTITLSYGAFALAWGLGHANLFSFAFQPKKMNGQKESAEFLYRSLQIGVVLLASGTILGGVWANASWGRFWGWDPKETWALIALFGYLALLHARSARWIGPWGMALGSVIAFLGILMAWYGVNFVLAAGFHSYGFGGGGVPYVLAGVLLDLLFVSFLAFRYNKNKMHA